ncbi:MAG TPA: protein kinase, partial [Alphaproteobacteria bacterium]|nr:protein kinase [Alphaproteobacteria bacterium]
RPLAEAWMQREASVKKRAEQILDDAVQIISHLPKYLADLEAHQQKPATPSAPVWPGRVAVLALLLAIASFFTNYQ